jgi:hypothetical protein
MTAAVDIVSLFQVGGGGGGAAHDLLSCLGLLLAVVFLPLLSYSILKARSFLNRSGKDKPDFTSLRSTGKTIVNDEDDEDDPPNFGGVN